MNVIDWLSNNYQWLFSGIGVVLLVSLFSVLISVLRKKIPKKVGKKQIVLDSNDSNLNEVTNITPVAKSFVDELLEISPAEIKEKTKHLSEIDFQSYFNSFNDHVVTWEGRIGTVTLDMNDNQNVNIQIVFPGDFMRAFFTIRIADFPNIKLFKSGDTVKVNGRINSPNWPTIDLVNVKILEWKKGGSII